MADVELTTETWKPVVGYEGLYEISSFGRVKSLGRIARRNRGHARLPIRVMVQDRTRRGYWRVRLYDANGKPHRHSVHRLVAFAFVSGAHYGEHVNHIDCDKGNNRAQNLEWTTPALNVAHAISLGRFRFGENHPHRKLTDSDVAQIRARYAAGETMVALGNAFGVNYTAIGFVVRRVHWRHVA